jgi:hypothetical protein
LAVVGQIADEPEGPRNPVLLFQLAAQAEDVDRPARGARAHVDVLCSMNA